jgi:hypothetical protein
MIEHDVAQPGAEVDGAQGETDARADDGCADQRAPIGPRLNSRFQN